MLSANLSSRPGPGGPTPYFLAADVGGTHARVALARTVRAEGNACPVELLHRESYACAAWPSLADLLADFIAKLAHTAWSNAAPMSGVLACAGYVQDDQVVNRNLPWPVSISGMQSQLGIPHLVVINDFEALAHAVPYVNPADMRLLMAGNGAPGGLAAGPIVVMGPGTGLGCAAILPTSHGPRVLATEAAHTSLAPSTPRELDILRMLAGDQQYVAVEHALSGPGLLKLYRAISALRGEPALLDTPAGVTSGALDQSSQAALEALNVFCALLGSYAADLAALYGAHGGIVLAGGILPKIEDFLRHSDFSMRFLRKGALTPFLQRVPVHVIDHGDLGVLGAACWMSEELNLQRIQPE